MARWSLVPLVPWPFGPLALWALGALILQLDLAEDQGSLGGMGQEEASTGWQNACTGWQIVCWQRAGAGAITIKPVRGRLNYYSLAPKHVGRGGGVTMSTRDRPRSACLPSSMGKQNAAKEIQ